MSISVFKYQDIGSFLYYITSLLPRTLGTGYYVGHHPSVILYTFDFLYVTSFFQDCHIDPSSL